MAMFFEDPPLSEGTIRQRFKDWSGEGYGYMAVVDETLDDVMAIRVSDKLCPIRKDNVREDLEGIYKGIGRNTVRRVYELSGEFDSARRGGLEVLPFADVLAVREKMAVEKYRRKVEATGFLDRVTGNFPEPD